MQVYDILSRRLIGLEHKLLRAGLHDKKADFLRKVVRLTMYTSVGITIFLFFILAKTKVGEDQVKFFTFLLAVLLGSTFLFFNYFLRIPDVLIAKRAKGVSKEIVYVGRFMVIEVSSGVPMYKAMKNVAKNFPVTGKYFKDITDRVDLGSNMEDAIVATIELSPSDDLNRILWQILNSSKTGSDIKTSLLAVLEQITREQQILVKDYGRKLNPLAMFYMMIAVIIPSLGTTMLTVLASFLGIELSLGVLIVLACAFGFMQFMFIAIMKSSRPPVDM
jgi:archaeal flagellar protein FlaJ